MTRFCRIHQVYGDCERCIADLTPAQRSQRARGGFHARVGQVGRSTHRCEHTVPLFPLVLILDADGSLAAEAKRLVEQVQA